MKFPMTVAVGLALIVGTALAQEEKKPATPAPTAPGLKTNKQKASYGFGLNIGKRFKMQSIELEADLVAQGIKDALGGAKPQLTDEQIQEALTGLQAEVVKESADRNAAFLEANKKKPGVKTTATGLQYTVIKEGTGKSPKATDTVKVHYQGTLIDGTEFDSSYKRGKPEEKLPVNGVIPGWTEALQLMKVGSKWHLVIPAKLAYGANPQPGSPIGPNAVLVFDVELLGIN